jgi:predicted nucleic acid-binding protein
MPPQILLDNTVLSNFALVGQINLLRDSLGQRAATVAQVIQEFERGVLLHRVPETDWQWLTIHSLLAEELTTYTMFLRRLSAGEAACLTVAYARKMSVMTDDRDARQIAVQYGIPKTGSIGVLVEAVHKSAVALPQANGILQQMIVMGYRSPVDKLDTLL